MISFVRAVWMNLPLNIFSTTVTVLTGLVIYAFYASCDPGTTGEISTDDEVQIFHPINLEDLKATCFTSSRSLSNNLILLQLTSPYNNK